MESTKKRFDEIDVSKGIGILLVITGHCFPDVSTSAGISIPAFRILHDIIYTFHMPLMFMLAGFLSQRIMRLNNTSSRGEYIKDRFIRLMIPYFVIGLIYMPIKLILSQFANQPYDICGFWQIIVGENPDGGLWYLWVLFVIQAFLGLFISKRNYKYVLLVSTVTSAAIVIFSLSFYRIDDAIYYTFFVVLGLSIGFEYEHYQVKLNKGFLLISSMVFCLSVFLTLGREITAVKFFCGISGSFVVLYISRLLIRSKGESSACKILKFFGKYSMDIYVIHGIVMVAIRIALWSILKFNYYVCTAAMLIGGLFIPILVSKFILRKFKTLKILFLGER